VAAAVSAAVGVTAASEPESCEAAPSAGNAGEWDEGEWEEGEEGEWDDLDEDTLAAIAAALHSSGSEEDDEGEEEEEAPPPLPEGDPDAWLLELSEDELLKLADEAD
jgi:hypothetical protein